MLRLRAHTHQCRFAVEAMAWSYSPQCTEARCGEPQVCGVRAHIKGQKLRVERWVCSCVCTHCLTHCDLAAHAPWLGDVVDEEWLLPNLGVAHVPRARVWARVLRSHGRAATCARVSSVRYLKYVLSRTCPATYTVQPALAPGV
eukprot:6039734-Prymnesium_polylepis.1